MTSSTQAKPRTSASSTLALYVIATWVVGILIHLTFQRMMGSWYDGLVFNLGFQQACLVFFAAFGASTLMALSAERHYRIRASLSRCLVHLATGAIMVPTIVFSCLLLFGPKLTTVHLSTIVGLELFFAITSWSFALLSSALIYETVLRRRHR